MIQDLRPVEDGTPKLNPQEKTLHDILLSKDQELAKMYFGSVMVLNDERNPDRLSFSAHGLRELMEKIPEYVDIKIIKLDLKGEVRTLAEEWGKLQGRCNAKNNLEVLRLRFLKKIEKFFLWFERAHPKRKDQIAQVLKNFDPVGRHLPAPLEKLRVNEWDQIWDYFKGVAHHRLVSGTEEFQRWKEAMERFLLDRFCPRTFSDQKNILAVIKEGERSA